MQKAADLFGLGTDAIRWIPTDARQRMDVARAAAADRRRPARRPAGRSSSVGTAGTVSTGAIDPLDEIAAVCREHGTVVPRGRRLRRGGRAGARRARRACAALAEADSVAVDPHKWLYAPLEAGCVLVRDPEALRRTFSYHPAYYHFDDQVVNFFELRPAELARVPRAQGVAGAPAGRAATATGG